ncbi:hypothetical protein B0T19DRAFT_42560 [Cercophora scortea]|uniref:Secreted protein n=1 Tax=Cercophora scortea TaxID=314031 RepID=A0AAE0J453_9PEZI|nr:hypothetical protein B0T19DRAFT_42560 [Cercophora scortea]
MAWGANRALHRVLACLAAAARLVKYRKRESTGCASPSRIDQPPGISGPGNPVLVLSFPWQPSPRVSVLPLPLSVESGCECRDKSGPGHSSWLPTSLLHIPHELCFLSSVLTFSITLLDDLSSLS